MSIIKMSVTQNVSLSEFLKNIFECFIIITKKNLWFVKMDIVRWGESYTGYSEHVSLQLFRNNNNEIW